MFTVFVKLAVSTVLAVALLVALNRRAVIQHRLDGSDRPWLWRFWLLFRLLPFLGVYVVLGYRPQSDVMFFYYPIGLTALEGGIPYRDVYSGYSPLFGYWLAPFLALWRDPRVVVLAMLLVEGLAVELTYRYYQTQESTGERLFRALFYYLLPLPFVMCIFSGQEDVILWLFALLALPFMPRRPVVAGLILGLGMLMTKAVFVLVLIPVWILMSRNKRSLVHFTAGLLLVGLPVVAWMYWKTNLLFLQQPLSEGDLLKAPNWRSVLNPFLTEGLRSAGFIWKWGSLLITLGVTLWGVWLARSRHAGARSYRNYVPLLFILIYGTMTVVQPNAISNYAYLFMLPLVFTLTDFRRKTACAGLIGFNVLAAIHPSLWWRLGQPYYNQPAALLEPVALLEYSIEILLVFGFGYYAIQALNALRRPTPVPRAEPYAV